MKRRFQWTQRRAVALLALACAALLEVLYGCAGERGVESFVDENIGEVASALTCDYVNCVAPDACHTVAASCGSSSGKCVFTALPDGTSCATGEVCSSGTCTSDCFIGNQLFAAGTVNPADSCQVCTPMTTTTSWTASATNGASCGPGLVCSTGSCVAGCYVSGTLYSSGTANPGNPCQVCTPSSSTTAWSNLADGTSCTGGDVCGGGVCLADCYIGGALYTPGAANPANACQVCMPPSSGNWVDQPDGTSCAPGELCSAGSCVAQCFIAGSWYGAGVANPADACQACVPSMATTGWSTAPDGTSCNDDDACTQTDTCQAGTCTGSNPVVCAALDSCHVAGTCDTTTGVCSNPTVANGTTCTGGVCQGGLCNNINLCTKVTCTAQDQCHVAGTCAPATGICSNPTVANGTPCNDNNPDTSNDMCTAGVCAGVDNCTVACTPVDQCHLAGTCNPTTGVCTNPNKANGTACDDGNPNTINDMCTNGVCQGVVACATVTCAAVNQCHAVGTCQASTGTCTNPNKADGTDCGAGNPQMTGYVCSGGVCGPPDPCTGVTCAASDDCHEAGTCQPSSGTCTNPAKADGAACTGGACQAGACVAGADLCAGVTCTAVDSCHEAGTCNPTTGTCSSPAKADCSSTTDYYACAAAPRDGAPPVGALIGAALALAGLSRRRRSRRA